MLTAVGAIAQKPVYESAMKSFGYKNDNGSRRIMPQYQRAGEFEGSVRKWAPVKLDGHWGCIDIDGNLICRNLFPSQEVARQAGREWEAMSEPGKWVYPARNQADGRWGFVDYYGRWKYQPVYEAANPHQGKDPKSFASVKKEGRWGCIDGRGVLVINNIFHSAEQAEEAGAQWAIARNYYTWRVPVTNPKTDLWGFVDYLGRWAVQPLYQDQRPFGDDNNYQYTQVKQEGRWANIDRNGNIISTAIFFTAEDAAYALRQFEHGRTLEGWRLPVTNPASGKWGWVDWRANGASNPSTRTPHTLPTTQASSPPPSSTDSGWSSATPATTSAATYSPSAAKPGRLATSGIPARNSAIGSTLSWTKAHRPGAMWITKASGLSSPPLRMPNCSPMCGTTA